MLRRAGGMEAAPFTYRNINADAAAGVDVVTFTASAAGVDYTASRAVSVAGRTVAGGAPYEVEVLGSLMVRVTASGVAVSGLALCARLVDVAAAPVGTSYRLTTDAAGAATTDADGIARFTAFASPPAA
jgi:hypothetical protein